MAGTEDADRGDVAHRVLRGERLGLRGLLPFVGPALVAAIAYVDPGNFATNIEGGSRFGYTLLWVVVLANATAMLFQALSARVGIVSGRNLAELCGDRLPRAAAYALWIVSELGAVATDLAEFVGGSLAITLLTGLPLLLSMVAAGIVTYAMLLLDKRGYRPLEVAIGLLLGVVAACYVAELAIAHPDWRAVAIHSVLPRIEGPEALTVAVGIIGATVMPHAIFLHSGLTEDRIRPETDEERRRLIRYSDREVVAALAVAGLVNMAILTMAAKAFHDGQHGAVTKLDQASRTLTPLLGRGAGVLFLLSLLASGLSSSVVGTKAGQIIMGGFVGLRIPVWARRLVTMLPSFAVIAAGVDPTEALVDSQVVLSLVLPVPMLALLHFSGPAGVLGEHRPSRLVRGAAWLAAGVVLALNALLLAQAAGVPVPFLGKS